MTLREHAGQVAEAVATVVVVGAGAGFAGQVLLNAQWPAQHPLPHPMGFDGSGAGSTECVAFRWDMAALDNAGGADVRRGTGRLGAARDEVDWIAQHRPELAPAGLVAHSPDGVEVTSGLGTKHG